MKQKNPKAQAELKEKKRRKHNARAAAERSYSCLMRHQDRYIKAYCTRFGVPYDQFEEYQLVYMENAEPTVTGGWTITRSARMERRT